MTAPPPAVTQVDSRAELAAFIRFPWQVYRHDPAWVPPLLLERRQFYDRRKHPFYRHGEAALFLARRDGEIVGRLMASDDPHYNKEHGSNVGCFGSFEAINDRTVAHALFEAGAAWLKKRGRSGVLGPIDYSTNYLCGLLINGFEHPPTILTGHNPSYYVDLFESWGFAKSMDLYAWWFSDATEPTERLKKLAEAMRKRHRVTIRQVDVKNFEEEAGRIRRVYNAAWEKNWGYVPFTEAEFDYMAKEMKPIIVPEAALLAEVEGEPIGFLLAVPDINVALKKINGRLFRFGLPLGLARLLYHKPRIRTGRLVALGVVEKYRRHGIAEMMVLRVMDYAVNKRRFSGELSLTLESNVMVNRFIEAVGAEKYKTYRIYERALS